jgi:hypothetical protein
MDEKSRCCQPESWQRGKSGTKPSGWREKSLVPERQFHAHLRHGNSGTSVGLRPGDLLGGRSDESAAIVRRGGPGAGLA